MKLIAKAVLFLTPWGFIPTPCCAGVFHIAKAVVTHTASDGYHVVKHELKDAAHGVKHAAHDMKAVAK